MGIRNWKPFSVLSEFLSTFTNPNLLERKMGERVDWFDLPPELWPKIGRGLENRIDVLRFRSVCKSWRNSIPPSLPNSPSFPLKIPHPINPTLETYLKLATLYRIEPPPDDQSFNFEDFSSQSSSSQGWLIKVEESESRPVRLSNPLSNRRIVYPPSHSPNLWSLLDYRIIEICKSYSLHCCGLPAVGVHKVVFFPNSCWTEVEKSVACCIYLEGKLGLMKYGDEEWTLVDIKNSFYDDVIVYKGQFYATDRWGTISWVDVSSLKLVQYSPPLCGFGGKKHLVESCGSLYVVDRYFGSEPRRGNFAAGRHDRDAEVVDFKVYKLDEDWGTWVDVKDLKDRVFILGSSCCFSVSAEELAGYQGNCIYFNDIFDIRAYNLSDRSFITVELDPCYSSLFRPPPVAENLRIAS